MLHTGSKAQEDPRPFCRRSRDGRWSVWGMWAQQKQIPLAAARMWKNGSRAVLSVREGGPSIALYALLSGGHQGTAVSRACWKQSLSCALDQDCQLPVHFYQQMSPTSICVYIKKVHEPSINSQNTLLLNKLEAHELIETNTGNQRPFPHSVMPVSLANIL